MKHEQSHLAAEKRNHTCDVCHKPFTNESDLNIHLKTHDPDRKFDCEVCGREFNRLNNLQRHMMVHQQVRRIFLSYLEYLFVCLHSHHRKRY